MIKKFLNNFQTKLFNRLVIQAGFFIFFLSFSVWGLAGSQFLPVDYLMGEAKSSFKQKDYSKSVYFLSQILSTNPNLKMAHELLNQLAQVDQLPAETKADIITCQDLIQFNNRLLSKMDYYLQKRNYVLENLGKNGYTREYLNNYLAPFQLALIQLREENENKFSGFQNDHLSNFKQLLKFFALKRDELNQELENIEGQFTHLRLLSHDRLFNPPALDILIASDEHQTDQFKKTEETSPSDKNNLRIQLSNAQQQLVKLQKLIDEKNDKVNRLTEELAKFSNIAPATNLNIQNNSSQDDLIDLKSRFELGQKIIQEKDKEIQRLQTLINKKSIDFHPQVESNNTWGLSNSALQNQLVEVSGILEIYKLKLSDLNQTLKTNVSNVVELENKLALVQTKLFEKDQLIQKTEQGMQKLEQKLLELQNELDNLRQSRLENNYLKIKDKVGLQQQFNNISEFLETQWRDLQQNSAPLSEDER